MLPKVRLNDPKKTTTQLQRQEKATMPVRCMFMVKKRHTLKNQVVIEQKSLRILAVEVGQGREHDFKVCKRSEHARKLNAKTELIADSGFQGVKKIHTNSRTPFKGSKKNPLTGEQKAFNRKLASERIVVEHVIRRLKVFRVLKEVYRHRRRRFGLRAHLLAGLYNADLAVK